jgi:hypothetical protein
VVEGRPGMTRLARGVFFQQRDRSRWERCLAEQRWSLTAVTARLVTLVVTTLGDTLQVHGAYWRGTATTVVAKPSQRRGGARRGTTTAPTRPAAPRWSATTGTWWG